MAYRNSLINIIMVITFTILNIIMAKTMPETTHKQGNGWFYTTISNCATGGVFINLETIFGPTSVFYSVAIGL